MGGKKTWCHFFFIKGLNHQGYLFSFFCNTLSAHSSPDLSTLTHPKKMYWIVSVGHVPFIIFTNCIVLFLINHLLPITITTPTTTSPIPALPGFSVPVQLKISMLTGKPEKLRKRILQTFLYKLFPISRPSPISFFFFSKLWFVLVLGNLGRVRLDFCRRVNIWHSSKQNNVFCLFEV